jgi:rhodanese-related sulfurtransferase
MDSPGRDDVRANCTSSAKRADQETFMKTVTVLSALTRRAALPLLALALLAGCASQEGVNSGKPSADASAATSPGASTAPDLGAARKALLDGAILVDVRSAAEFAAGHPASATNVPLDEIAGKAGSLWKKETNLVLVCASGHRAARATESLRSLGFTSVTNGGTVASFPDPPRAP